MKFVVSHTVTSVVTEEIEAENMAEAVALSDGLDADDLVSVKVKKGFDLEYSYGELSCVYAHRE